VNIDLSSIEHHCKYGDPDRHKIEILARLEGWMKYLIRLEKEEIAYRRNLLKFSLLKKLEREKEITYVTPDGV
jgi:hypothetical protein